MISAYKKLQWNFVIASIFFNGKLSGFRKKSYITVLKKQKFQKKKCLALNYSS